MKHVHIIVTGRVQGVGFRWSTKREADKLGVMGYVRNSVDGNVAIMAQGPAQAVEALIAWSRRGPSFARVSSVDVTEQAGQQSYTDFSIQR